MYFVVLYQGEIVGTSRLDDMGYNQGFATGVFEPHPMFAQIKPIFEQAPERPFTDFYRKFAHLPEAVVPFCQARDALHLQLWRSDGQQVAAAIIAIQYSEREQLWTIAVHADDEGATTLLDEAYQVNGSEAFATYTRPWQEAPRAGMTDDAVVARAIQILERKTKNNPVLIGEMSERRRDALAAIVAALHHREPSLAQSWDVVELDPQLVHVSSPYIQATNTLNALLSHSWQRTLPVIFIMEEFDQLALWGGHILRSFLARGQMQMIGTATLDDYRQHVERDMSLQRRMQEVLIERLPQ